MMMMMVLALTVVQEGMVCAVQMRYRGVGGYVVTVIVHLPQRLSKSLRRRRWGLSPIQRFVPYIFTYSSH